MTTPAPVEAQRLYTVAALARLWGVGTSYVYDEIAAGRLASVQLGNGDRNKLRVTAREADRFIAERTDTTPHTRLSRAAS